MGFALAALPALGATAATDIGAAAASGFAAGAAGTGAAAATGGGLSLSSVLGLAGTGVSALGALSQSAAASRQAAYEAQVAQNNQTIANQNAAYAAKAGEEQSYQQSLRERQREEAVVAGLAASGVDVNSGSARQVRESENVLGQTDVANVRQRAALEAYGYRSQAANFGAQAQLERAASSSDLTSGYLSAGGTLLSGASKFIGGGGNLPFSFGTT